MIKMKEKALEAIANLEIDCSEFEHHYNNYRRSYSTIEKEIEGENFNIYITIEEEMKWWDEGDNERVGVVVTDLKVITEGKEVDLNISDKELRTHLNYY